MFKRRYNVPWCLVLLTLATCVRAEEAPVSFAYEVRPILSDKCFLCHGPDEGTREADLRLDSEDGILYAFAEGGFDSSEAWDRIHATDKDLMMPPPEHGKPLTSGEIDVLRRWMEQGAAWTKHWSFNPPRKPELPEFAGWGSTPIDAFIHRRLLAAGLDPAPPAEKAVLIRRLSFDLTGLPPTVEQIDSFLADQRPDAYERLVDRLLASPRYGERLASVWLDAARYSDTYGYQRDEGRFVWPWRDWVIRALNNNQPYDEFVRHQLAGDQIENPTQETRLATTFNRLHGQNSEGGSIPEEFRMEYVADRTQTVASAMLGLTMECCRCHDHKYDPLTIKDYYSFSAFFDKIDEAGLKSFFTEDPPPPILPLTSDAEEKQIAQKRAAVAAAEAKLADELKKVVLSAPAMITAPEPFGMATFDPQPDNKNGKPWSPGGRNKRTEGVRGSAVLLSGDHYEKGPKNVAFERHEPFSVGLWVRVTKEYKRAVVFHASRAALDSASRGYEMLIEEGVLSAALVHYWPGNAIRVNMIKPVPQGRWVHVAMTYDGSSRADGLRIFIDGQQAETEVVRDNLTRTIIQAKVDQLRIGARFRDSGLAGGAADELCVYKRCLSALEVSALASPEGSVSAEAFSAEALREHHAMTESDEYVAVATELAELRRDLVEAENQITVIMAMEDYRQPKQSYIRNRGAYGDLGDPVDPSPPAVLPSLPEGSPQNRLALADWLGSPDNPLTARVAVNRIWQALFGAGLVRTPEDFGAQGLPPTHPYLLEHLATSFVEGGWDQKALIKTIVMSDVYKQSTIGSPVSYEKDPTNKLLARATRRRWPAEMLRDNALAVSGLLVNKTGGKPVKPYEVAASFKPIKPDKGEGLYRRSLYTYFKRSAPAPVLTAFDAPDRSVCRVKRERTQSPMQALVLLNGPQFVEAARVLAENALKEYGEDDAQLIESVFRQLTSQKPTADEARVLTTLLERQRERFADQPGLADELLGVGDRPPAEGLDRVSVAASTILAQTVMSCDKCVTRQ